uniref:Bifunctional amine oxidase DDB_G0291301 n=1 Tax=Nicotiana tabacum TaxID=4097 RepID=A0A1S3ZC88_TOBAC|nr:PREDICTED: uncharacterized protein LOC107785311 [Nicotiana tabacum]
MTSACSNNPLISSSFLLHSLKSPNVSIFFPKFSNPISSIPYIQMNSNNKSPIGNSKNPTQRRSKSPGKYKPRYGTSRKSTLKKSLSQEQVNFTKPIPEDPVVGIIGGGMSGLACALYLEKRGIRSTVFDTGIHGLGGRMGTRMIDHQPLIFDHAAQFFTVTNPKFVELVDDWLKRGLVREWQGTIGELELGGHFVPFPSSPPKYIGVNGMRPLADSLLSQTSLVNVVRPCWVSTLEPFNGTWHLSEKEKPCGQFDAIVIAHNGKNEPEGLRVQGALE